MGSPSCADGPVVKRLRHRPFTAVTRVRFPSGSPTPLRGMTGHTRYGGIAQLVERPPHTRKVTDSSSVVSTTKTPETERFQVFLFSRKKGNGDLFGGRPPPTGQVTDSSSVVFTTKAPETERFQALLLVFLNFLSGNLRNVLKMSYKKHLKLWLQVLFCLQEHVSCPESHRRCGFAPGWESSRR